MAKLIYAEDAPPELKAKLNFVKNRVLFLSPSVSSGHEREPCNDDFEALSATTLGTGGFGEVYKVRHKVSKNIYAIKVIGKKKVLDNKLVDQIRLETRIMYSIKHEHIIKLYNHFEDDKRFYLVLELAPKGHLYEKLKLVSRFSEKLAAQYMREVIAAVQYLHSTTPPIIHRDIKPENILLDAKERAKLCDFGWSNFFNPNTKRMTYCGTPDYLAPEMIKKEGHDQSIDIWNLGVLLFELLAGNAPFGGSNQRELFSNILKLRINFPKNFPKLAKDLVLKLLKVDPKERLSLDAVISHPWFKNNLELHPVPSLIIKAEKQLPTLENDLEEEDFEAVSRVSKVNREEEGQKVAEKVKDELKDIIPTQRSEKDNVIENLTKNLQAANKELNELKGELQAKVHELESAKEEYNDLKKKIGGSPVGYESPDKQEIRRLKEEIMKYTTINKGRHQTSEELYRTTNELSERVSQQKLLNNELNTTKDMNKILESKLLEAVEKLKQMEKKYEEVQESLKEEKLIKEKSKVELEFKIEELKYKLNNNATNDEESEEERMVAEAAQECQISLKEVEEKIASSMAQAGMNINFIEEIDKAERLMEELKQKHKEEMHALEQAQEKALTELRAKHSKELKEEKANKNKAVEELELQMFQYEEQEGKAGTTVRNEMNLQEQNLQLQKAIEATKLQVELSAIGYKSIQDKLKNNELKIQQLISQLSSKCISSHY